MIRFNLQRKDIFVTSKLATKDQGYENTIAAVKSSLKRLDLEYIDLYLIHWPGTAGLAPDDPQNVVNRQQSWRALEDLKESGVLKAIGVSNYLKHHLEDMKASARMMPAVNQFELHPAHVPHEVIEFCSQHDIFIQTYASLGEGRLLNAEFLAKYPDFNRIAEKHNVSVPQVLLNWAVAHGWGVIPKSVHADRIRSNFALYEFKLDSEDMLYLDNFHKQESFKTCWDPAIVI